MATIETEVAHLGQPGWLPPPGDTAVGGYPQVDGLALFARHRWAGSGAVPGGDFYDFVRLADGSACVVLGDVSGAGLHASVVAQRVTAELRVACSRRRSPSAVLEDINRALLGDDDDERYCTAVAVVLEVESPRATIVTGGHALPLLVPKRGGVHEVGAAGMLIGMFDSPSFAATVVTPAPGDTLLLYTDGVTEARTASGSFRPSLLSDLLERNHDVPLPDLTAEIIQTVEGLQEGWPRDDIAVVALRWLEPAVAG